jgi:hypothetical protein
MDGIVTYDDKIGTQNVTVQDLFSWLTPVDLAE